MHVCHAVLSRSFVQMCTFEQVFLLSLSISAQPLVLYDSLVAIDTNGCGSPRLDTAEASGIFVLRFWEWHCACSWQVCGRKKRGEESKYFLQACCRFYKKGRGTLNFRSVAELVHFPCRCLCFGFLSQMMKTRFFRRTAW